MAILLIYIYFLFVSVLLFALGYFFGLNKKPITLAIISIILLALLTPAIVGFADVYIFDNSSEVTIPDVIGKNSDEALNILKQISLNGEVTEVSVSNSPENTVISQEPEPGKTVKTGRTVKLTISARENFIQVPELKGRTTQEAQSLLSSSGLKLGTVFKNNPQDPNEIVIDQNPKPNEHVQSGASISIITGSGDNIND